MTLFTFIRRLSTSSIARNVIKPPTQFFGLEGRYATALYSAAVKSKNLEAVEKDMTQLHRTLEKDTRLREFCTDPTVKRHLKVEAFKNVLAKLKFSSQSTNMLLVLAENGRLGRLAKVLDTFRQIMTSHRGEVSCVVTTAKPLDKAVERELMTALGGFLEPGHKLNLHLKVDPDIIGGMIVSIGDKYVDMSILRKIRSYRTVLEQPV
uniref:Oligomycin sensitivity conferral protein n=1 Tax=Schistocephalus solidus TaxID=70667 RepID=A0A0X3PNN8_SCHSO